jgi:predicted nuclease with TOPRIM domain
VQARRKYQEVLAEKQQLQMDNEELQSKYNQKVM